MPRLSTWSLANGLLVAGLLGLSAPPAPAQELVKESLPDKWLDQYAPEKLPELKYPAYFEEIDKAREQVFRGRYKAALITLQNVKKGEPADIALIKGQALAAVGRRDEAVKLLSDPAISDKEKIAVLRGRVLAQMGKWDDAITQLKAFVDKNPESVRGRYYLGEAAEQMGNLELAKEHYAWIQKTYWDQWQGQGAKQFEDAELVTLMGRAFDRHATLNGLYANNTQLNNILLKVFVQAYDVIDREYWPAHVAAAEYFLARSNPKEAAKELMQSLAGNPQDARSLVMMGLIGLEQWNFDQADKATAGIRRAERYSLDADVLEARNYLQQRRPKDAEAPLKRVLDKQPKNLEAMGLLAGACALQLKEDRVKELLAAVEKIDANNATAYHELGDVLGGMRQYPRAEKMYRVAIERAPWWTAPRNGLGLLLTQSGDEDKAKAELDAAYSLDPFNFRTTNYLILLDQMAKMDRVESDHFIIIFNKKEDPLAGLYFADYMESVHADICKTFHYEPTVKTMIEVFPGHDAFSVRTTGSPWIGTVGASTGRVIAMVTPRTGASPTGPYNWSQVLRHEYTHTVTLGATENRIGHWMTEGLAVYEEHTPLRWEWVPMLYNAVTKNQLFNMENLTWAFVRPKKPQDRSLAYAESYWICKYISEKWSHDKLLDMMAEFKKGKGQEEVFPAVLGEDIPTFEKGFFAWADVQVSAWGYDKETTTKYNDLTKKADKALEKKDLDEALKLWEEAQTLRPMDRLPHQKLALIYRAKKDQNKAIEQLIRLHEVSLDKNIFAKGVARAYLRANEFAKAEAMAMQAVYVEPYDLPAHELLLECHEKANNAKGVEKEKLAIGVLKQWILEQKQKEEADGTVVPAPEGGEEKKIIP